MKALLRKIFGSANDRAIRRLQPYVNRINELEPIYEAKSDDELRAAIAAFKEQVQNAISGIDDKEKRKKVQEEVLMKILPDVFAIVREAAKRTLGQRHYDVQLMGGIVLHQGKIAEMKTGEGKTLTSTLPLVLNALTGRGAHLVTVNEYLARRDSEWMGRIYKFLGLTVGLIYHGQSHREKQEAYRADITYGTNNEFGFDYLRDNMKYHISQLVQRELHYAIVDEVDSILIDEARTPLIISGPSEEHPEKYIEVDRVIRKLVEMQKPLLPKFEEELRKLEEELGHPPKDSERAPLEDKYLYFVVDEKDHSVKLTEKGVDEVERMLGIDNLYDPKNIETLHLVHQSLVAYNLYHRDKDYIIMEEDGKPKVVIVDEFTGRIMPGRRWSDGLHQAIEAKEGVPIESENQTLATITFQNFFRLYEKLAGMTGTAETEAVEFKEIYDLDVVVIPTNKPMIRIDHQDVVYKTAKAKWNAIVNEIERLYKKGQPVLVGTVAVETSEMLSRMLKRRGIPHQVLNAKYHEKEAEIIALAGRKGAVTIATNMAGRGTDIILGGNLDAMVWKELGYNYDLPYEEFKRKREQMLPEWKKEREEVIKLGGLYVLGTERHESRRIDNQLRGRSGRQGEPGESRFFVSLEDELMRLFGGERLKAMMERLKLPDDEPIEHRWITKAIEKAQRKVEIRNFDIRKNLLEYDDVMNQQRKTIYTIRRNILEGGDWLEDLKNKIEDVVLHITSSIDPKADPIDWPWDEINEKVRTYFRLDLNLGPESLGDTPTKEKLEETIYFAAEKELQRKIESATRMLEKMLLDQVRSFLAQIPDGPTDNLNWPAIAQFIRQTMNVRATVDSQRFPTKRDLANYLVRLAKRVAANHFGRQIRNIHLEILDRQWKDHLLAMDHLREGIGLRGYGQKDPKQEYKKEGYELFETMIWRITTELVKYVFMLEFREVSIDEERIAEEKQKKLEQQITMVHGESAPSKGGAPKKQGTYRRKAKKVGRNDPCPCGSGKKFKHCHWGQPGYEQYM